MENRELEKMWIVKRKKLFAARQFTGSWTALLGYRSVNR
jgi:hypothetical protein